MTGSENGNKTYPIVRNDIAQFLSLVGTDNFTADQIDRQYNYRSREAKNNRWHVLEKMAEDKEIEKVGLGKYRKPKRDLQTVEWWEADPSDTMNLAWPLNLQRYVKTYHRSIIIVAGSPGAGKTAFLYDFILRNMYNEAGVYLFSNDMSPEEMFERFSASDIPLPPSPPPPYPPSPPPFITFDRADNFGDVLMPDAINVIDYLDLNSDLYLVGEEIEKIYRKLGRGIALIGLQKKPGQELAYGGVFSAKRAKLYISLDEVNENGTRFHKLAIRKARGRVDPSVNPRTVDISFKLVGGIKFVQI